MDIKKLMSHTMKKTVFAICEQQRRRSACTSMQSNQHLCFCCLDSIIPRLAIARISRLASLCSWAGQFESYLVENPEDRFSRDESLMRKLLQTAHMTKHFSWLTCIFSPKLSLDTNIWAAGCPVWSESSLGAHSFCWFFMSRLIYNLLNNVLSFWMKTLFHCEKAIMTV